MASGGIALGLAVLATAFVLGRGPGSLVWMTGKPPTWMPFAGAGLSWVPFASDLEWLPFNEPRAPGQGTRPAAGGRSAALTATAAPSPGAHALAPLEAAPTPRPAPAPSSKPEHGPAGGLGPTPDPWKTGTPAPTSTPTPTATLPVPTATLPAPTPTLTVPTPTPAPTPILPAPTPTPVVGVTLFAQTFESDAVGSTQPLGMTVLSGSWKVITDSTRDLQDQTEGAVVSSTGATWQNYRVTASVKDPSNGHAYVVTRAQDAGHFYVCGLDGGGNLFLGKLYGGNWYTFSSTPFSHSMSTWYTVTSTVSNTSLTCTVTDPVSARTATVTASESYFSQGPAGFAGSPGAEFDNLLVSAL